LDSTFTITFVVPFHCCSFIPFIPTIDHFGNLYVHSIHHYHFYSTILEFYIICSLCPLFCCYTTFHSTTMGGFIPVHHRCCVVFSDTVTYLIYLPVHSHSDFLQCSFYVISFDLHLHCDSITQFLPIYILPVHHVLSTTIPYRVFLQLLRCCSFYIFTILRCWSDILIVLWNHSGCSFDSLFTILPFG